jgi:muramoyltetrapeptide carboxypeptidase LdcA involved in peptidoglycan recycling
LLQKNDTRNVTFWEKNIYMYSWGSLCNLILIAIFQPHLFSPGKYFAGYSNVATLLLLLLSALGGLSTSLLLQHLDVVAKEYANFFEVY